MCEFARALISSTPNKDLKSKLNLFGQFVGEWDFDWQWMSGEIIKGEWIFSWILEGTAIQDVWICPSREERQLKEYPYKEYGTTVRFYNPQNDEWDVIYGNPNSVTILKPRQVGETIVLEAQNVSDYKMRWVFSDIKENSFTWQNKRSDDDGVTWIVQGEMKVTRKYNGIH